ncbi:UDP-N-acetylmuramoyl-L-alanine--D-glutamate ligase [Campylobacter fetus]|uniref:UDP-N-acetylmuramoyl-L-alanine--D-glutamate ligase n=1 Tax=Campylobacter fetus TaxID=196 RepID=UPI0008187E69|nr:UDP-N-acetylmuramoyl-L-alanine--D-glutamate ligase [Campylobacter fetus]EAK0826936.1 UDP-N-acetylmuramoyl-L-alanine--D-glutamate ligase [Campylobacter fetus]OCR86178.1 UDP-N-acetylmuramoyl-L-alanyl-D-glutamate synthetase [Campylobacter fetus subsp. testudinum]
MRKSLFGYGKTTKAISKSGGWDIYDDNFKDDSLDEFGNRLLNPSKFNAQNSSLEIPSPGFPCNHDLVKSALNLISEYDYFINDTPKSIWISGTNGKTTTTKMTQWLLGDRGSAMGGNVGTPLADLLNLKAKVWVLETSSFTIHYTKFAKPDIYVLLPITPDHLSWHGSMQEYEKAKLKPLSMMREGSVAIIPKKYANISSCAKIIEYENEEDLASRFDIDLSKISFRTPFLIDALLALCIEKIIFSKVSYELLNKFEIETHKLEEFKDRLGRLWVDDTKATNIDATLQALKRYKNDKLHIILGGDDKGVSLDPLFDELRDMSTTIYAIGSNAGKISSLADKFGIKCINCEFLNKAVENINMVMKTGEIGLLSPACASLDQFKSYAERGDMFKKYVKEI